MNNHPGDADAVEPDVTAEQFVQMLEAELHRQFPELYQLPESESSAAR